MKTLYLECNMGAAGDMLAGALYALIEDKENFLEKMNALGLPGVTVQALPCVKCGITGTHFSVTVHGGEERSLDLPAAHVHQHAHAHDAHHAHHAHPHTHRSLADVHAIIDGFALSDKVKNDVKAVYALIAAAEGHAHGRDVTEIHFHEVGTLDAIADITAVCLLMDMLAPARVVVSPVNTGSGFVQCAHGILPVPAPATEYLLRGVPIYSSEVKGELCTPTGAALLKYFATDFGRMPAMTVENTGYGMGNKDFPYANCVRAMLGEIEDDVDIVYEYRCNIDDMTAENIAFAAQRLFDGGALEVFTQSVYMKKNRPGILLTCLCAAEKKDALLRLIFKYTTTLGVREYRCPRYTLTRTVREAQTDYGAVRIKRAEGYGVVREKPEHDDLARIAKEHNIPPTEIKIKD